MGDASSSIRTHMAKRNIRKPKVINSMRKLSDMEADIDDFCFTLEYGKIGNIIIEVLSRPIAKRRLLIVGTEGTISYCGESNTIVIDNTKT